MTYRAVQITTGGGEFTFEERLGEKRVSDESPYYTTDCLIKVEVEADVEFALELRIINTDDDYFDGEDRDNSLDVVHLQLNAYHVTNPDTNRTFHGNLRARLDRDAVEELRDFLNFLLGRNQSR